MIVNKVVVEQVPSTILPSAGGGYQMKVNVDDQNKATIITQDPSKDGLPPMKISIPLDKLKQAADNHVKSL